jgi:NAD(P)-dependent dehydrogenase (short-subunit alcohol dehydrogenase family)
VIMDLRSADGEAVAKSISDSGGRALFVAADAAVEADVGATIALGVETFGAINMLVNNVARTSKATLAECTPDDWSQEFEGTLKTAFLCCRAVLPLMVEQSGGAIVNTRSVNGFTMLATRPTALRKPGYSI